MSVDQVTVISRADPLTGHPAGESLAAEAVRPASRPGARFVRLWLGPALVALALFEILIRSLLYTATPVAYDPLFGWRTAPGARAVDGSEGFGRISINRQGVRGRDLPAGAAGRVHRLLLLGDSFTEARQVDDDQTFGAQLEARLSRQLRREVWIGNAGQSALEASDYLYYLPAYEQKLHPELFLIAFSPWDFKLNEKNQLAGLLSRFDPAAPPGQRVRTQTPAGPGSIPRSLRAVLGYSSLARYAFLRWRPAREELRQHEDARSEPHPRVATVDQMVSYFQALVARSRTPIAVTYINFYSPVEPNDHHVEEERIREAATRLSIPFIPTSAAFREDWARTGRLVNGFQWSKTGPGTGHLNPRGHQIVARALSPSLAAILADPSGLRRLRAAEARAQSRSEAPGFQPRAGSITSITRAGAAGS
jgi:hypothetical protein